VSDSRFINGICVGLAAGSALFALFHVAGTCGKVKQIRDELIEKGYAEWVVDPKTGETQFKIKEPVK
jgi:hypothetical protein